MRKLLSLWVLLCSVVSAAEPEDLDFVTASSLPPELRDYLSTARGLEPYSLAAWLNPYYVRADFDGDDEFDIAVLVEEKPTGKRGVLIIHGDTQHFVLGAGNSIGNGGDNFSWMDAWYVFPQGFVEQGASVDESPPRLRGDALMVVKTESASAIIFWNGTGYAWYQQGD